MIKHDSRKIEYRDPFGAAKTGSSVRLSVLCDEDILSCELRIWDDECEKETVFPMKREASMYSCSVEMPSTGRLWWYYFIIRRADGRLVYLGNAPDGLGGEGFLYDHEPPSFQITVYEPFEVPEWYKNALVYQIFPDRFAKGSDAEQRAADNGRTLVEWSSKPAYNKDENGDVISWEFYGGTLEGVREKLPYLKMLGVSAIYFNPVFEAASNHRYDTKNYMHIDPLFGDDEGFASFCREAESQGIRVILDGVFSHTGRDSIYFEEGSPYREWFSFGDYPNGYACWWGVKDLPEVNEMNPSYIDYICSEDGVIGHWLKQGAAGFRLDVADELPDEFIRLVREAVKRNGSDKLLIGEVWEDASNKVSYGQKRRYLMGRELDACMNYPFRSMMLDFAMHRINSRELARRMESIRENYPRESFYGAFNLLGSHDRRRLLTELDGVRQRLKMISALTYASVGVPVVYYGDEAGLTGGSDPENRAAYPWESQDGDLLYHYRMLGLIYAEHSVLKDGSFDIADFEDDDIYGFVRENDAEKILAAANRNYHDEKIITYESDDAYAIDLLSSEEFYPRGGAFSIPLAQMQCRLLLFRKKAPERLEMQRSAGVICHITSIPGGRLGSCAKQFVDFIASAGFKLWQILPVCPVGLGDSPYLSPDVFSVNESLINWDELPQDADRAEYVHWFAVQWVDLLKYAHSKGVRIIGDLPIYVDPKGRDVRRDPQVFQLHEDLTLKARAGVPPDYFQKDGQDWGNPLYDWDYLKSTGYEWWMKRMGIACRLFDYVRLDHFRSFSQYYMIPEGKTASQGYWQKGPGLDFFNKIKERFGRISIIAEDLGDLDNGVFNLLKLSGIPGMNVWQFSAEEMENMPPEIAETRIFYSSTHDNNTLKAWSIETFGEDRSDAIIEKLYASDAPWVIFQLQDILGLGEEARMNIPGTPEGNWGWRADKNMLTADVARRYAELAKKWNR